MKKIFSIIGVGALAFIALLVLPFLAPSMFNGTNQNRVGTVFEERVDTPTDPAILAQMKAEGIEVPEVENVDTPVEKNEKMSGLRIGDEWDRKVEKENGNKYVRADFGTPWADADHNGCDTRNDILWRDLSGDDKYAHNCVVQNGTLVNDFYTQEEIEFVRGQDACQKTGDRRYPVIYDASKNGGCSNALQVDHIVSLEEFHYAGVTEMFDAKKLENLANDPLNLVVTGVNSWKSSKTPSEILNDPNSPLTKQGECNYADRYTQVMTKYDVPVRPSDAAAVETMLQGCSF